MEAVITKGIQQGPQRANTSTSSPNHVSELPEEQHDTPNAGDSTGGKPTSKLTQAHHEPNNLEPNKNIIERTSDIAPPTIRPTPEPPEDHRREGATEAHQITTKGQKSTKAPVLPEEHHDTAGGDNHRHEEATEDHQPPTTYPNRNLDPDPDITSYRRGQWI